VRPWLAIQIVAFLLCNSASALPYGDPANHFSYDIPDGWTAISREEIAARLGGNTLGIVGGARAVNTGIPYCTIQVVDRPTGDTSAVVAKARRDIESTGQGVVRVTQCAYDESRHAVITKSQANIPSANVAGVSYTFIGKNTLVSIHCYDLSSDVQWHAPIFEKLANSFRFDPGYGFSEYYVGWGTILNVGIGVALVLGFVWMRWKKGQQARAKGLGAGFRKYGE
jgi:hypothetical protein